MRCWGGVAVALGNMFRSSSLATSIFYFISTRLSQVLKETKNHTKTNKIQNKLQMSEDCFTAEDLVMLTIPIWFQMTITHRSWVVGSFFLLTPKFCSPSCPITTKKEKDKNMNHDDVLGRKPNRLSGRKGTTVFCRRLLNLDYERHCGLYVLQFQHSSCGHLKWPAQYSLESQISSFRTTV